MVRKIIHIDEEKCNGCGLCAEACHEGAIGMAGGKAKLLRDDYCDGLGDCLPTCPAGAITFVEREAAAYDEEAVRQNKRKKQKEDMQPCGCPGSQSRQIDRETMSEPTCQPPSESQLRQWPVQIKLAPVNAPYFDGAHLLIAADCTAYAYGSFHQDFIRGKVTLIGCPKLDSSDYSEKLAEIIRENDIKSLTVVRMEVPCCGGIEQAAVSALKESGKFMPWQVVTVCTDGTILE
ncbi:ATP-binding protein [Dorea sp. D27]|uniref:ATP-binding protein n=1 Tax=Dorea sp. D27 TaxID=658665 RepID=UPI0006736575|nr:4Fe-4S binding protein [Dorea sp. D27]KMZ52665.1 iron-sulfur cluster-binding protein [Dorea sp. D27]